MTRTARALALLPLFTASTRAADLWVDAIRGSNVTGNGSQGAPWQTITFALSGISGTNTVHVLPGLYQRSLGENFPLNLPTGTTLSGTSPWECVVDAGGTANVIVPRNDCAVLNLTVRGSSHGWYDGGIANIGGVVNVRVEGCLITGNERGIVFHNTAFTSSNVLIRNNVVHANLNDGISQFAGNNVVVINNTLVGNLKGVVFIDSGNPPVAVSGALVNNIIQANLGGQGYPGLGIDMSPLSAAATTLTRNNVFGNTGNYGINVTPGATDLSVDSLFVNQAGGDLHLSVGSPCHNQGNSLHPSTPAYDFDGSGRPYGGTLDIGADEIEYPDLVNPGDLYAQGEFVLGNTIHLVEVGNPAQAAILAFSPLPLLPAPIPLGSLGDLWLNPSFFFFLFNGALNAQGVSDVGLAVPTAPPLIGVEVAVQGFVQAHLTRPIPIRIH